MPVGGVIYLEWLDSDSDKGWLYVGGVTGERTRIPIRSVGFIVCENAKTITITTCHAKSPSGSEEPDEVLSPLTIPKCAIVKQRTVRVPG